MVFIFDSVPNGAPGRLSASILYPTSGRLDWKNNDSSVFLPLSIYHEITGSGTVRKALLRAFPLDTNSKALSRCKANPEMVRVLIGSFIGI